MNSLLIFIALVIGYFMISDKSLETQVKNLQPIHYIGILIVAVFVCNMNKKEGYCENEEGVVIPLNFNDCDDISEYIWTDDQNCYPDGEHHASTIDECCRAGPWSSRYEGCWEDDSNTYEKCCMYPGDSAADATNAPSGDSAADATGHSGGTNLIINYVGVAILIAIVISLICAFVIHLRK